MAIREEFERSGVWLFRWRSYVPLLLLTVLLVALRGFTYPAGSHGWDGAWDAFCMLVAMSGLVIRLYVVGHAPGRTSGRNTRDQVADVLNTTGLYSVVRHPLYVGNFLIWMGVALFPRVWWCVLIVALAFILIYERIVFAEERFLQQRFGDAFEKWAERTPSFWPRFRLWEPPALPFSIKHALKGEYSGFFGIIALLTAEELIGTAVVEHRFRADAEWTVTFAVGLAVFLVLRRLKHRKMLDE